MTEKGKFGYIFTIWVLVFVIVILFFLYFAGFLYSSNPNQVSSIPLGSTSKITLDEGSAFSLSFDISGEVLPNEKIPQNINIYNNSQKNIYVRAKAYINTVDSGVVYIQLITNDNWEYYDNYYYYNGEILSNETIALATYIVLNEDYNFTKTERYIVNILAESLNADLNITDVWGVEINFE